MGRRSLGVFALALLAPALAACCRRPCERPAGAPAPAVIPGSATPPLVGIQPVGDRGRPEGGMRARVTVLDDLGRPVPGARVTARREGGEGRAHGFAGGSAAGLPRHETDRDGVVVLDRLVPGEAYHLFVGAPRDRSELRDAPAVEAWLPHDQTVRLQRWRVIRGVVRDADGSPVVGAGVSTRDRAEDGRRAASTDEAGRFTLERIPDGTIGLEVELHEGLLTRGAERSQRPVGAATVTAGDEGVVVIADVGKELVVRLQEPDERRSSEPARGRAEFDAVARLWIPAGAGGGALAAADGYVRGGIVRFRGLRADEDYSLWLSPSEEGGIVYEPRVRSGELRVLRRPGRPITVNVRAPATATEVSATVKGPFIDFDGARRSPPSPVVVRGVPEGTWRVWAWAHVGNDFWTGSATAVAGSAVEVEVTPPRPSR